MISAVWLSGAGVFAGAEVDRSGPGGGSAVFAGYVPAWGVEGMAARDPAAAGLTHLIYAFAKPEYEPGSGAVRIVFDFEGNGLSGGRGREAFESFLANAGPDVRRLLSIGGWGLSESFSDIAASGEARESFAEEAARLVADHGLDGVDLDWEYPVAGGAENMVHRPEDAANFVKLARAVRGALDDLPRAHGESPSLLTIAIPGSHGALVERYRIRVLGRHVDWFNLMAYDYAGGWSPRTAHYSPLRADRTPLHEAASAEGAVASLRFQGVPPDKIVLGMGLSGVRFEGVRPEDGSWLGAHYESVADEAGGSGADDFRNLDPVVALPVDGGSDWVLGWDRIARASYWTSARSGTLISFESVRSAEEKAAFAAGAGLRGLMFWSVEKDSEDLRLIRSAIGGW
ncbi:MAG: glycoside hydrolase family 18 protein [Puniceicoccaceae bacterium]